MEHQLTVRLPQDLNQALKEAAGRSQRKPSEIVRMALREFLESQREPEGQAAKRAGRLIGSLKSGIPDLALKHRDYIVKSLRNAR